MKKGKGKRSGVDRVAADEILPEYNFRRARLNKYASRFAKGGIVVTLDPDVAAVFPGASQANEALRALAGIIRKHPLPRGQSRRSA